MIPPLEVRELSAYDYFQIVWKRIWILIIFLAIGIASFIFYNLLSPKMYTTSTTVVIQISDLRLVSPGKNPMFKPRWTKSEYQTQLKLLRSNVIADRVIRKLNLTISRGKLLSMVSVGPVFRTNMVRIIVQGKDPVQITDIANTWTGEIIDHGVETRKKMAGDGISKLEAQIEDTLKKLQESERELNKFLREHRDLADLQEKVNRLKKQKVNLEDEIIRMSAKFKDGHQKMISLKSLLASTKEQLNESTERLLTMREGDAGYDVLIKRKNVNRTVYKDLIMRSKLLRTSQGLEVPTIRVVDSAQVPRTPAKPPIKIKVLVLVGSLFLGLMLCFLLEIMDSSLKTPEEVEFYAKMPFLGYMPLAGDEFKKKEMKDFNLLCHLKPYSQTADAFRNIEISLNFTSTKEKPLKTLLITSALPLEGKTFLASNLAIIFARAKEQVLLIDADMQGGELSKVFEAENEKGLSTLLKGECTLEEAIVTTQVPNLSLLPSGPSVPAPIDLLELETTSEVLSKITTKYNKAIIDVPSIKVSPEALVLGDKCNGTIFAIKEGITPYKDIVEVKKRMEKRANIVGAVLNSSEIKKDLYYYLHYFRNIAQEKSTKS